MRGSERLGWMVSRPAVARGGAKKQEDTMVRGLNKVQLIGNLGRDPELRYTAAGAAVANVTVAVNRLRRGPDGSTVAQTEWFRVVLWDTLAETAVDHLC